MLIPLPPEPGRTAKDADEFLLTRNLIVRQLDVLRPAGRLRLTVGLEHENRAVVNALAAFVESRRG